MMQVPKRKKFNINDALDEFREVTLYTGKISKINEELKYGFIDTDFVEKIFFNEDSLGKLKFNELKLNDYVYFKCKKTKRGLLATFIKKDVNEVDLC